MTAINMINREVLDTAADLATWMFGTELATDLTPLTGVQVRSWTVDHQLSSWTRSGLERAM
jgi:hypothetical protein